MVKCPVKIHNTGWTQVKNGNVDEKDAYALAARYNAEAKAPADAPLFIVADDYAHPGKKLVVRDEYDPYDPQRRKADCKETKAVLGWQGARTPLHHGLERLVQYLLANPRELRGLDGRLSKYDYEGAGHGRAVAAEYLLERLKNTAVPITAKAEAQFVAARIPGESKEKAVAIVAENSAISAEMKAYLQSLLR